ncbi:MAG: rhomboid family intramembrane serine protease [Anaerolineae bacterium]|nr:rhomboid family intramembrane serine protease [Anaerolineae bacterium]
MKLIVVILTIIASYFFLLPLKDRRHRKKGFPWMTLSLVILNVLIFIGVSLFLARYTEEDGFIKLYPFLEVPQLILDRQGLGVFSVLSSGFLHGGIAHLVGNMFALWFFGRKVEDATGPMRFLFLYLLCLFTSSIFDALTGIFRGQAALAMPSLGASGAIFGIMTAYLFLYSGEQILTFIAVWIIPIPVPLWIPAWVHIVQNLMVNALIGELVQEGLIKTNVGVFAHLGGGIGGLLCIFLFVHPDVLAQRR